LTATSKTGKGTISLFNGPQPDIKVYKSTTDEIGAVGDWLTNLIETGLQPHEIALFVRSTAQLDRPKLSVEKAGVKSKILDEHVEITPGSVSGEHNAPC
jgi:superfamily I DNA/RNA helicase